VRSLRLLRENKSVIYFFELPLMHLPSWWALAMDAFSSKPMSNIKELINNHNITTIIVPNEP
jgi:hypothetical protein